MYKLGENKRYKNVTVFPKGTNVNVRKLDSQNNPIMTAAGVVFQQSTPHAFGIATGRQIVPNPGKDAKGNTIHGWMEVKNALGFTGWVRFDLMTVVKPTAVLPSGDGIALINNIINRDYSTYHKILYNEELIKRLKSKGINISTQEKEHQAIVNSYGARCAKLEKSNSLLKLNKKTEKGFEWLKNKAGISGIGIAPGLLVGGALILTGLTMAATALVLWNSFQSDGQASELDLKRAETLAGVMERLSPETKAKILTEINTQVQETYDKGYTEGKADTVLPNVTEGVKSFTNLGLVALAAFVVPKFF